MTGTEMIWLQSQAAQRNFLQLLAYGTAFAGTAALQAIHMGVTAPRSYWAALSRAAAHLPPGVRPAEVVPLAAPSAGIPADLPSEIKALAPPVAAGASAPPEDIPATPVAKSSPHLLDAPRGGAADDLTALKGVGAKLAQALNEFGIYHFDQIAALDEDGIAWLDAQQKGFRMICARHDIVGQARTRL